MSTTLHRQPEGIPAGGQFAATVKSDKVPGLEVQPTLKEALDLTTLAPGQSRTLTAATHGLQGIDTITLTNHGHDAPRAAVLFLEPAATAPAPKSRITLAVTLPEEANIAELYEFDDWSRRGARSAALSAVEEHLGLSTRDYARPASTLPEDTAALDQTGNLSFEYHEAVPGHIDPEDFASWMSGYADFSDPLFRQRLQDDISERYNER